MSDAEMHDSLLMLKKELLALNYEIDIPFNIVSSRDELIASWKIVDAKAIELFGMEGLKKQFELKLIFDVDNKTVRYTEKSTDINWDVQLKRFIKKKEVRLGSRKEFSQGASWGIKEDGSFGQQYAYKFRTRDIKNPIFKIVQNSGWHLKLSATDKVGCHIFTILIAVMVICGLVVYLF